MTTLKQERPDQLESETLRIESHLGNIYVTVADFEGRAFEVFVALKYKDPETRACVEAIARLASLALQLGSGEAEVFKQLEGHKSNPQFHNGLNVMSIPDAVAHALNLHRPRQATEG